MARNRANIPEGTRAYVGNLGFDPRQLLPEGTVEYQVKGWYEFDPEERPAGGAKGVPFSVTIPVGTSRAEVEEAIEFFAGLVLEDAYANFQETDSQLGMDIFDLMNQEDEPMDEAEPIPEAIPEAIPIAEFAMSLDEWIDAQDGPVDLPEGSEGWTLRQYFEWRAGQ